MILEWGWGRLKPLLGVVSTLVHLREELKMEQRLRLLLVPSLCQTGNLLPMQQWKENLIDYFLQRIVQFYEVSYPQCSVESEILLSGIVAVEQAICDALETDYGVLEILNDFLVIEQWQMLQ
jgi:hypothetical protein